MIFAATDKTVSARRLDSWKAIAHHLGRSARTVQRWHQKYAIPVHQLGGASGSVFAYVDDLDSWLKNRQLKAGLERPVRPRPLKLATEECAPGENTLMLNPDPSSAGNSASEQTSSTVTRALKAWHHHSSADLTGVTPILRQAVDQNCDDASAFAWLAQILILQFFLGTADGPALLKAARAALSRAQEIEPALAEVRCAEAWDQLVIGLNRQAARSTFEVLQGRDSVGTSSSIGLALLLVAEGRGSSASKLLLETSDRNPLNAFLHALSAWACLVDNRPEPAKDIVDSCRAVGHRGNLLDSIEALVCVQMGPSDLHLSRIESLAHAPSRNPIAQGALGYFLGTTGEIEHATAIHDQLKNSTRPATAQESYAVALGRHEEALTWLNQSRDHGSIWTFGFQSDPFFAELRDHPGFGGVIGKSGPVSPNGLWPERRGDSARFLV
jgi:hypothetical protein